jgi:general nucleoside transport system permease protein
MLRLEARAVPGRWRTLQVSLVAVLVALVIVGLVFAAYGVNPFTAYWEMLRGTLLDARGLGEVGRRSIPLLLIGAGLTLAFRAQFFNIGAEGQILFGAVAAGGVALFVPVTVLTLPLMFVAGAVAGGGLALLAAWLRQRFNVNEILSTLMLNYGAFYLLIYLINGPWKGKNVRGFIYSDEFSPLAQLPVIGGTLVHYPTLILGILVAIGLQVLLTRSTLGYELRVVGENPGAARYAGISIPRVVTMVALVTGGAAGLAGAGEVAGIHHRLLEPTQISLGYGFTAVIVAWLARGNPGLVLVTAPFMAIILAGGDILKIGLNMPFRIVDVFSGVMLLCLIASELFVHNNIRLTKNRAGSRV